MKSVQDLRKNFLEYFQSKKHHVLESASLFPAYDPTLLFTTAGMVPLKPYFAGTAKPVSDRIVTIQKCMRTTDLSEVGQTKRHLSFFEMLGNFSFGDYFKKEAIEFAWEYAMEGLRFPKENIWVTIYLDDDEAFSLWKNHIGVPEKKIHRLGKKDNFWGPAGSVGVCGPCSELYLDRGEEYDPKGTCKKPGDDGERFMEFWNLVFNQFHKDEFGEYTPLQKVGIDTGAGLERIASLVQGVDNLFETNELSILCQEISSLYDVTYTQENQTAIHILTDHIRTLCFAIGDGILPSNESRGYVLRRILRRAMLYGMKLNRNKAALHKAVAKVVEIYGEFYPELKSQEANIRDYISNEETRFLQTLSIGSEKLDKMIEASQKNKIIRGKDAFLLYDTYGFPLEMTIEIAYQHQLEVDTFGFEEEMETQRQKGRLAWKGDVDALPLSGLPSTEFTGYEKITDKSKIFCILHNKKRTQELRETDLNSQENFYLIMIKTPFYPEGGGQLGDHGHITGTSFQTTVADTQKSGELILHICHKLEGVVKVDDEVQMQINQKRRDLLRKNHSATHLLNASLKKILGDHIRQTGSFVHTDYLRFDFSHSKSVGALEIEQIENNINEIILDSSKVFTSVLPKKEAEKKGAIMTFGEKYGEVVRVVEMGDSSIEFCGGTHVNHTGELDFFLITKESSPGAGNRRIEAVSSEKALKHLDDYLTYNHDILLEITALTDAQDDSFKREEANFIEIFSALEKSVMVHKNQFAATSGDHEAKSLSRLWQEVRLVRPQVEQLLRDIRKKIKKEKSKLNALTHQEIQDILASAEHKSGIHYYTFLKEGWDIPYLKTAADSLREKCSEGIYILHGFFTEDNNAKKWNFVLATSRSFAQENNLDLGKIMKSILKEIINFRGGGGGSKELPQASGSLTLVVEAEHLCAEINNAVMKHASSITAS